MTEPTAVLKLLIAFGPGTQVVSTTKEIQEAVAKVVRRGRK